MSRPTKKGGEKGESTTGSPSFSADDFASELIKDINKDMGSIVAYNVNTDITPTEIKRWISTGSTLLDYVVSNRRHGGLPEGRIVEFYGPPSIGKSHIAIQLCISAQRMGGVAVYVDTENGTSLEYLQKLGVNGKKLIFVQEKCIEKIFEIIESAIKHMRLKSKDIPMVVVWDSIAGSKAKAVLEGNYEDNHIGIDARALSKGFAKVTDAIGKNNILLACFNQTRLKIGVMYGDPTTTPGGQALPYYASVRVRLTGGAHITHDGSKEGMPIGIEVNAYILKNKVGIPYRKCSFNIMFNRGIREHEEVFDVLRQHGPETIDGKIITVEGTQAWKTFSVADAKTGVVEIEKKFYKPDFKEVWSDPKNKPYIEALLEKAMVTDYDKMFPKEHSPEEEVTQITE